MNWPNHIRKMRREFGLTQVEMAKKLGISFATMNRWERGHFEPSRLARVRLLGFAGKSRGKRLRRGTYCAECGRRVL